MPLTTSDMSDESTTERPFAARYDRTAATDDAVGRKSRRIWALLMPCPVECIAT